MEKECKGLKITNNPKKAKKTGIARSAKKAKTGKKAKIAENAKVQTCKACREGEIAKTA